MRRYFLITLMLLALAAKAEDYLISGTVIDKNTNQPVPMATVRLMKADSTFISGASSSASGVFNVNAKKAGKYILKFSYIGYVPVYRDVTLTKSQPTAKLGNVTIAPNDIIMKSATVKARLAKLEMHKDTFVYNVAAYRVPEGATLEALIDKLPGAVVDDDGGVTINGKTVSEVRVDGKDFFKGDTKVAMKNMPVSLINRVKVYDMQSDYTQQTGIDDGNEKTVMDLELKKKLKSTLFSNIDLAYGNHDRYSSNVFVNRFTDNTRISVFGSMNNVGDRRFRGGGPGFRGGSNGLSANKNVGVDGFWNNGKKEREGGFFQIGGNVRLSHVSTDALSRTNSETFLNTDNESSFSNSSGHSLGKRSSASVELNLRWNPDTLTSVYMRPNISHNESNSSSNSLSATFNSNPYEVTDNPLDSMFRSLNSFNVPTSLSNIAVNRNSRMSIGASHSNNYDVNLGITRRLNNKGRSISLDGGAALSNSDNFSYNISDIFYYQRRSNQQVYSNQYSTSPSKSWNYNVRASYSEPLAKNLFLQTSYNFRHRYSDSDRSLFQLDSLAGWGIGNVHPLGMLPEGDSLNMALNIENSRYATYRYDEHTINVGLRYVNEDFNLSAGLRLNPERTKLDYKKNQLDTIVTRDVFNVSPDVRLRWNMDRFTRLELRYRGSSSQPSMTDLLDVTDTSDPLNISKGNPGLKPSWSNNFNLHYNTYLQEHQRSFAADASFSQTSNSISNAVVYDPTSGVRTTRPENINGNWRTNGWFMFNTSFGPDNIFFVGTDANVGYSHNVGFISTGNSNSEKNTVKTLGLGDRLRVNYRNDFFEVGLNGSINYDHSRSSLQERNNMDTYTFAYGWNLQLNTTWNMSVTTDMAMNSRRGFTDHSMNTNELVWNAMISQSFLAQNNATLQIQFYDILHQRSNISRSITAQMRRDSWSNGINSYFMVHFIYRMNLFGGIGGRINTGGGGGGNRGNREGGGGPRGGGGMGR
ncbi:MAG: outer membrane beta-barrel protein [Bacteroidaceae bacterium]|nr:outer membrane beta-barrel protein [Bacteroidaceae bacterium]